MKTAKEQFLLDWDEWDTDNGQTNMAKDLEKVITEALLESSEPQGEKDKIIDLLIREVDGAWWSESYLFRITDDEATSLNSFIAEYNKDGHLDLLCDYHVDGTTII